MFEEDNARTIMLEEEQVVDRFAEFKDVANKQFEMVRNQAMILGIKVSSEVILNKITSAMNKPGKRSLNDYKRLVKEIEDFCRVAMKPKEETVQN